MVTAAELSANRSSSCSYWTSAVQVAQDCLAKAKDLSGLLLLHTATGSAPGMQALVATAHDQGKHNVEFLAAFLLGQLSHCVDLLISSGRISEAAFFARTYVPSRVSEVRVLCRVLVCSSLSSLAILIACQAEPASCACSEANVGRWGRQGNLSSWSACSAATALLVARHVYSRPLALA